MGKTLERLQDTSIVEGLQSFDYTRVGGALLFLVIGMIVARVLAGVLVRVFERGGLHRGASTLVRRISFWSLGFVVLLITMEQVGIELTAVIAAAGFVTIAIGFAAQTAFSNIISGIFLLFDRPFVEDEVVEVGNISGIVMSIDLLSTKIRTWDNIFVRIPNSDLMSETIRNLSRHPIRRIDITVLIPYKHKIPDARKIILDTALAYHAVLEEPDPTVFVNALEDSGTELMLRAWVPTNVYLRSKSDLMELIKESLQEHGITIAIPHRDVFVHGAQGGST
jgi:small-conductance mechanosensitive channel